jgi:ribonucleoside-diphosphate reductase alpha chain
MGESDTAGVGIPAKRRAGNGGLRLERVWTTAGVHPFDEVTWERRDVVMTNWRDGSINFEQRGVEFPDFWSVNATNIVTTKYFRGAVDTPEREWSLKQLINRVVKAYRAGGEKHGYFATAADAEAFEHELAWMLLHQVFSFNSPVWFNVGTASPQQVSACQPYDALVSTLEGLVPIGRLVEQNAIGAKVYDAQGVTKILAVKANGVKDVLRLHTKAGYTLDVTADHLVWKATGEGTGRFVEAGTLRPGDQLERHAIDGDARDISVQVIDRVEALGAMEVYDIQTESGEYLSGNLRVHNCFILSVDDSIDSIMDWYKEEGLIFKGGSGSGINLSRIRSSKELLSSGGTASGPVSFMRGADASAGTIKSGGATRRAAKMVILDVDHPDIEEFIATKAREEDKIRALRDAGFDMDLGGHDIVSVQYQNANNSVRVSDEFMRAVEEGKKFELLARLDGSVIKTVDAKDLFRQIAQAAWECADPGIQYDDTINHWNTASETGRITASNPCSEYVHLDDTSCNLASLNLLKFLNEDSTFDVGQFVKSVEYVITAMDISISFADFPTQKIAENTRAYRQLGIGYANLGALLMASGLPYDSEGGRSLAAGITALMTGAAYRRSAELAGVVGAYDGYPKNEKPHKKVMQLHAEAAQALKPIGKVAATIAKEAQRQWQAGNRLGDKQGWRNAQASVLAPTGTIGFMLDCDTTGVEPDLGLVKFKKLVGGGSMQIVNQTVPRALRTLGYHEEQIEAISEHIAAHGHVVDAPGLRTEHYPVFDCAMGDRSISATGHVLMMAAVQPFISGAISKTVNMPESATVEDVEKMHFDGWKLGLKALAIYRDNCKVGQPLSVAKKEAAAPEPVVEKVVEYRPVRKRLPKKRPSQTVSFTVGDAEGYLTASSYPDDGLGEVFLKLGKQGSTLAGVMDAFSIAVSVALQYGVPLRTYVEKFMNMKFEPAGMTDDSDIRLANSVMDYIFRRLALDFLPYEQRAELGVFTASERAAQLAAEEAGVEYQPPTAGAATQPVTVGSSTEALEALTGKASDAPLCYTCGTKMRPAGSCYVCEGCGSTSGCS